MTRKHFKALAEAISKIEDEVARRAAAYAIAPVCRQFNPSFDRGRFLEACGV